MVNIHVSKNTVSEANALFLKLFHFGKGHLTGQGNNPAGKVSTSNANCCIQVWERKNKQIKKDFNLYTKTSTTKNIHNLKQYVHNH